MEFGRPPHRRSRGRRTPARPRNSPGASATGGTVRRVRRRRRRGCLPRSPRQRPCPDSFRRSARFGGGRRSRSPCRPNRQSGRSRHRSGTCRRGRISPSGCERSGDRRRASWCTPTGRRRHRGRPSGRRDTHWPGGRDPGAPRPARRGTRRAIGCLDRRRSASGRPPQIHPNRTIRVPGGPGQRPCRPRRRPRGGCRWLP